MEKIKLYRCESCGKVSKKQDKCCGYLMKDLGSPECASCGMCGHHG